MTITINIRKLHLAVAVLAVALLAPATAAWATHVFDDVDDTRFYAEAVEWALANDITTGTGPTTFEPDRGVTRGENITFAKRYDDNIVLRDTVTFGHLDLPHGAGHLAFDFNARHGSAWSP